MATPADRPLIILNPAANRGHMRPYRALIHERISGDVADYRETARRGDATKWARDAAERGQPIIIVGGDGTINEVANGVLSATQRVPLGIIPAGSGNDFACYTLGLPLDPAAALDRALRGATVAVDAGTVNGRYFVNSFSVGLDADITLTSNRLRKLPLMRGPLLYYASALRRLVFSYGRCPWMTISVDGAVTDIPGEKHYVLAAMTNGPTYGGGFKINPTAEHADGALDLCAVYHPRWLRAISLLPVVQKGQHGNEPEIRFYRVRELHISSRRPVNAQIDGETFRDTTFTAQVLPGALTVRV